MKFSAALLAFTFAVTSAFAQGGQAPQGEAPKVSKAEVQKLVDSIKGDPQKMTQYCAFVKLQGQYATVGKDAQKMQALDKQIGEVVAKLGPDFERIGSSEMDDDSITLLDGLSNSCK
jgi:hypothetical protein